MKVTDTIDTCLITVGSIYSLANIEHILGIIILCIQLAWIISKFVVKLYNKIKNKEPLEDLNDDVNNIIGSIEDIRDALDDDEVNDNERDIEQE